MGYEDLEQKLRIMLKDVISETVPDIVRREASGAVVADDVLRRVIREELDRPKQKLSTGPKKAPVVTMSLNEGFIVSTDQAEAWRAAYPTLNLGAEASRAWAWCKSNPSKAPRKAYARFLNAWLARAAKSEQKRPEAACAHCSGSLAAGSTSSHVGLICNPCWDAYLSGQWR